MNTSTYFRDWLYTVYKPCILVYSSEKVKALFNKNNLTPADFLRPLGDFQGRQITYPFNDKENINIPNLRFDFFDSDKFQKVNNIDILQYITTMFDYNSPKWDLSTPTVNKKFSEPYLNKIKYNSTIWYREFEKTIFECLQFNDYEFLQQPLINIYMCCIDEPVTIINDELNNKKNLAKLINEEKYENPKEKIIILIKEKKSNEDKSTENKNENDEKKEENLNVAEQKTNEEMVKNFIFTYKDYYVIYWEINENNESNVESNKLFRKYLHRVDLYNPNNDFYRRNGIFFGKYLNMNDIIQYKEDFFKYVTNIFLNKSLELISVYNNIIKQKKSRFNFFQTNKKVLDEFYPGTNIYKLNDVERAYYNLGLIYFYFRQYNYSVDNFKSFIKLVKEKSPEHRNRLQELLMIIKFLLIYNTKKEFDINSEIKKLPDYSLEQEIKLEFLIIKMFENNSEDYNSKDFLNSLKINIYNFVNKNRPNNYSSKALTCLDYAIPVYYEKISIYLLKSNKIRNFSFYIAYTGSNYSNLYKEMKPYALYSLSQILFVIDNPNQSFINFRERYNEMLGMNCNEIKYYEGALKFFRNCLEYSYLKDGEKNNFKMQNVYLNFYLNNASKILQEKIICENINIKDICVPLVDNRSLFILDENDYLIKKSSEMILETERKWDEFLKYNVKLIGDPYNDLDENDINHVKFINDISNNISGTRTNISTKVSQFNGYVNQKLYVQFIMSNPLGIDLVLSSIKLLCDFIPEKEDNNNNKVPYICSDEKINLTKLENAKLTLYVQALVPGKIIVKGLEVVLFKDCKVINYFNKKPKKLYTHRRKSFSSQGSDISNELNNSDISTKSNKIFSEKIKGIYSKRIIEYFIKDYNSSLFVDFPMGLNISLYLYEFLMYPIIFTNNSDKNRVKRITIFIENCNDKKLYKFFDYITKEIHLNKDNPTTKIFIPILPTFRDDLYIKLLVKFSDEKRIKPIAVKPFIIKINIKRSLTFEFRETFYKYFSLNNENNNKMDINLKADITMKEKSDVNEIILKDPILNKKYILINQKNNETNDNKIHMTYNIETNNKYIEEVPKEENSDDDEEEKIKKRDYSKIIQSCGFFLEDKEGKNLVDLSNNHIYEKFNDMIVNMNSNVIIFPWESKINEENKENEKNKILKGIYIYELKLKNQNISKNYIRELFYNSTKLEPIIKKINEEKNLVIINLSINKSGLITLGKSIDKYDIFIDENTPFITWFGPNKFTFLNEIKNENDTFAKCRFTFYTSQKGMLEINKIYVLLYKKFEGMEFSTGIIQINHITKPLYLNLE